MLTTVTLSDSNCLWPVPPINQAVKIGTSEVDLLSRHLAHILFLHAQRVAVEQYPGTLDIVMISAQFADLVKISAITRA